MAGASRLFLSLEARCVTRSTSGRNLLRLSERLCHSAATHVTSFAGVGSHPFLGGEPRRRGAAGVQRHRPLDRHAALRRPFLAAPGGLSTLVERGGHRGHRANVVFVLVVQRALELVPGPKDLQGEDQDEARERSDQALELRRSVDQLMKSEERKIHCLI